MTQPNQSEQYVTSENNYVTTTSGKSETLCNQSELMKNLVELSPYSTIPNEYECKELFDYITANYTPNTKLKALIEASVKLNLEFHGRPDCKNCSLQEQLAELTKAKDQPDER